MHCKMSCSFKCFLYTRSSNNNLLTFQIKDTDVAVASNADNPKESQNKSKLTAKVLHLNVDIIGDAFWKEHPTLLNSS